MIYLIALFVGFTTVFSMVQNTKLSTYTSLLQTTLMNFLTGLTGSLILFGLTGTSLTTFSGLKDMPLFGYVGGLFGVCIVFLATFVMNKISVIAASMLMYTGQMIAGFMIDYARQVTYSPLKIGGVVLIILGVYINAYFDKKSHVAKSS